MTRLVVLAAAALALAGCSAAPDQGGFARDLGRGIGEGLAAGLRDGAGPVDAEAVAEAIGRGLARGAAEELRVGEAERGRGQEAPAASPKGLPQLPSPPAYVPPPPPEPLPKGSYTH